MLSPFDNQLGQFNNIVMFKIINVSRDVKIISCEEKLLNFYLLFYAILDIPAFKSQFSPNKYDIYLIVK